MDNNSAQPRNQPKEQPQNQPNLQISLKFGSHSSLDMHVPMNPQDALVVVPKALSAAVEIAAIRAFPPVVKAVVPAVIVAVRTLDASNPSYLDSQPFLDAESEGDVTNAPPLHPDLGIQVSLESASPKNTEETAALAVFGADGAQDVTDLGACAATVDDYGSGSSG